MLLGYPRVCRPISTSRDLRFPLGRPTPYSSTILMLLIGLVAALTAAYPRHIHPPQGFILSTCSCDLFDSHVVAYLMVFLLFAPLFCCSRLRCSTRHPLPDPVLFRLRLNLASSCVVTVQEIICIRSISLLFYMFMIRYVPRHIADASVVFVPRATGERQWSRAHSNLSIEPQGQDERLPNHTALPPSVCLTKSPCSRGEGGAAYLNRFRRSPNT